MLRPWKEVRTKEVHDTKSFPASELQMANDDDVDGDDDDFDDNDDGDDVDGDDDDFDGNDDGDDGNNVEEDCVSDGCGAIFKSSTNMNVIVHVLNRLEMARNADRNFLSVVN